MNIRPLSSKLQLKAQYELNEVPSRVLDDLKDIEEWLLKQPHLNVRKDRQWLLAFLRSSKFSLQRTKEKLDYFYTIKSITPEFFAKKDPMLPEVQQIMKSGTGGPVIKSTDAAGFPTLFFVLWKNADPNKRTFSNFLKTGLMYFDVLLQENDNCTVNGIYLIYDMTGFSLSFAKHLTPALCKKAILSITKAYPLRIRGMYFINTPPIYETFINLFTPFLSEKMKNRFKIFGEHSFHKLLEEIPLSVFPKEYGGTGQSFQEITVEWKKTMEDHNDWFIEDAQYGSDEAKRPGKPKTSADIFGVEGSFRKLIVD